MRPQYHPGFSGSHTTRPLDGCTYSQIISSHAFTPLPLVELADAVEQAEDCEVLTMRQLQMATGCDGHDLGHGEREEQFSRIIGERL